MSDVIGSFEKIEAPTGPRSLNVAVCYASKGRAELLKISIDALKRQTRRPSRIIVGCTGGEDVGDLARRGDVEVVFGPAGASRQRNAVLSKVPDDVDIIVFFDDDFVPHPTWLSVVAGFFEKHPDVMGITGNVVFDGAKGPGIGFSEASELVEQVDAEASDWVLEGTTPYGCNMAFRRDAVRHLRFDERLVLYSWLEDQDFGSALIIEGKRLVKLGGAVGVHMGVKQEKVSGLRFGYSQVVNPVYLMRKGTMSFAGMSRQIFKNMSANVLGSLRPEPFVDRLGRLRGNLLGLADVLRGRLQPERAARL